MTLTQVADTLWGAGFRGENLAQAIALVGAESEEENGTYYPGCISQNGDSLNTEDWGLWQMNNTRTNLYFEFGGDPPDQVNQAAEACAIDPICASNYAYRLWALSVAPEKPDAVSFSPWDSYKPNNPNSGYSLRLPGAEAYVTNRYGNMQCGQFDGRPYCPATPDGNSTDLSVQVVASVDPNDKVGTYGFGTQRYVSGVPWLRYAVSFANQATATAPAQKVAITDQLDATNDDLRFLSLGPMAFGSQLLTPPPLQASFSTTVDLRPTTNLLVAVNANLNSSNGVLTWNFQSLDPSTGQPPSDPTVGFLPPGVGGSTFFTVMPKQGLATNTQIQNQATIVFDANAPINTPTWSNTLDNTPPTSHVLALPNAESCPNFKVSWSGSDVGSGTKSFTILYSDNGGPFTAWLTNTASTGATFQGQLGHSYGFYGIAQDLVGNVEPAKTSADATTQVGSAAACGPPSLGGSASVNSFSGGTLTLSLQLSDTGTSDALNILIKTLTFRTLGGSGAVTLASPAVPISVGNISVGEATTETVTLNVPSTVTKFSITEAGTLRNAAGTIYNFSMGQVVLP